MIVAFLILLGIAIFRWLWNTTMPEVFGLKQIGFWAAFRLLLIAAILSSGSLLSINPGG